MDFFAVGRMKGDVFIGQAEPCVRRRCGGPVEEHLKEGAFQEAIWRERSARLAACCPPSYLLNGR